MGGDLDLDSSPEGFIDFNVEVEEGGLDGADGCIFRDEDGDEDEDGAC